MDKLINMTLKMISSLSKKQENQTQSIIHLDKVIKLVWFPHRIIYLLQMLFSFNLTSCLLLSILYILALEILC